MFQIGDLVMYGGEGACRIEDICQLDINGLTKGQLYYVLRPMAHDGKVYAPVNGKVFMRSVISRSEALALIDSIPDRKAEAFISTNMRELNEHYQASFLSHDCADLIEVIMKVYAKRQAVGQGKKIGQTDEKYMKRAEDLLYSELSVVLDIPRDEVQEYIFNRVETLRRNATPEAQAL